MKGFIVLIIAEVILMAILFNMGWGIALIIVLIAFACTISMMVAEYEKDRPDVDVT